MVAIDVSTEISGLHIHDILTTESTYREFVMWRHIEGDMLVNYFRHLLYLQKIKELLLLDCKGATSTPGPSSISSSFFGGSG
jgi:hypothetical protein